MFDKVDDTGRYYHQRLPCQKDAFLTTCTIAIIEWNARRMDSSLDYKTADINPVQLRTPIF